ncbi:MAG: carbamate kinase [Spongiibacteraceae bacterium]|nr:carbamate kinase [Spongiibacteraceae bacterium]
MRIVVALGGNALLRRGQSMTMERQRENVRLATEQLASIAIEHELVITHGNGPQVGLLALQSAAYDAEQSIPLDVLGAETEGMIGYLIEQELGNVLPFEKPIVTLLTQVEVSADDPAFSHPDKPIGPVYDYEESKQVAYGRNWVMAADGDMYRRVVPSPIPKRIFEINSIKCLLERGVVVICGGGGGIPCVYQANGSLIGVEAVIDKDRSGALLARQLHADYYLMLTDVEAVISDWGSDHAQAISHANPSDLAQLSFVAGSMGPKVQAACEFVNSTNRFCAIGRLQDIDDILGGRAGTHINKSVKGIRYYE